MVPDHGAFADHRPVRNTGGWVDSDAVWMHKSPDLRWWVIASQKGYLRRYGFVVSRDLWLTDRAVQWMNSRGGILRPAANYSPLSCIPDLLFIMT
jgi:hypothetical protein